jgi:beta-galactosidase
MIPERQGALQDTWLYTPGWLTGLAWVNGYGLGRYNTAGPQRSLYVPAPWLRSGRNELILLELSGPGPQAAVELRATPSLI